MSEPFIEINPEEAISEIINCLSNGKTSKSLKNDFEFVSTNSVNEQDEHLCKFFVDKANDGFFDMNKASLIFYYRLKNQFIILLLIFYHIMGFIQRKMGKNIIQSVLMQNIFLQ